MANKKVAVIVGSLRKESINRKMARALMKMGAAEMQMEFVEIGDLPLYNEDVDVAPPKAWTDFRSAMKNYEAVLFVTPEYNRSMPGCLKNAIDVGSRPMGQSIWSAKPAGIVTVSPGAVGGFGANHHLRQSLVFLNMPALAQPEAYIGGASKIFNPDGSLVEPTAGFMQKFVTALAKWVDLNATKS